MSKERPILFQGAMVRALLAGTKTQTRRALRVQPFQLPLAQGEGGMGWHWTTPKATLARWVTEGRFAAELAKFSPYGQPGDRLWVRETWMPDPPRDGTWAHTVYDGCKPHDKALIPEHFRRPEHCLYRSTWTGGELVGWTPAIHMSRWASRLTLEVTGVRVERLQDISEADAFAEGIGLNLSAMGVRTTHNEPMPVARALYRDLWEAINGAGSWDANPWVWVVEFKRA